MLPTVAALYIDPLGPYPHIPGVECWGLPYRDARRYEGPWPVVAHPPCGPWGRLRHLSRHQDASCALRAVDQVRQWGGVLEHPAGSKLWEAVAMPRPDQPTDQFGGYTVAVNQCNWGHVARKLTWLYMVGISRDFLDSPPAREPTHACTGGRDYPGRKHRGYTGNLMCASAQQRRRTPPLFAEYLVSLARAAGEARAA